MESKVAKIWTPARRLLDMPTFQSVISRRVATRARVEGRCKDQGIAGIPILRNSVPQQDLKRIQSNK